MVEIPETALLTLSGLIFIPLFIYLIKNVMEQGNIKSKIEKYEKHLEDTRDFWSKFTNIDAEIGFIKQRLHNLEADLKDLFRRRTREDHHGHNSEGGGGGGGSDYING